MTLRDFVASRLKLSNRKAKELLDSRLIFVNGHRVWMAGHILARGDRVETGVRRILPDAAVRVPVLYRDDHYLVANKPAGIVSTGASSVEESVRRSEGPPTLRAVHRLDRDTTGCLLLARNADAFDRMVAAFDREEVRKIYHAIAVGYMPTQRMEIKEPVDGKTAFSRLMVLDSNSRASHVLVEIRTGRTHQIRKHLAHIHHPVLGDKGYGVRLQEGPEISQIPRQMLHAARIDFPHPFASRRVRVESRFPPDFAGCLRMFRLS